MPTRTTLPCSPSNISHPTPMSTMQGYTHPSQDMLLTPHLMFTCTTCEASLSVSSMTAKQHTIRLPMTNKTSMTQTTFVPYAPHVLDLVARSQYNATSHYMGHLSDPPILQAWTLYVINRFTDHAPICPPIAELSKFIISVDILWHVSLVDCLFTLDFPLFADNPLLDPFVCESHRVYWLYRTGYLPSSQRRLHLIIIFPFSTLYIALFSPSLFHRVMLNVPPSIHPSQALRHLIQCF